MNDKTKDSMERDMMLVFDHCMVKAEIKSKSKHNTVTPWMDFTTEHLIKRLDDEWNEWKESGQMNELIDIINMAAFVWLSKVCGSGCNYTECEENTEECGRKCVADYADATTEQVHREVNTGDK